MSPGAWGPEILNRRDKLCLLPDVVARLISTARALAAYQFYAHSVRTWRFGLALARIDDADVDEDLLYVAAMLHDVGLRAPVAGRCFTLAGAEAAKSLAPAQTPSEHVEQVQLAILAHIDIRRPADPLGRYLQAGSLLDVAGTRISEVDRDFLTEVCDRSSRAGFPEECRFLWRGECRRFPHGRAAYARRPGGLLLATRLNPLPR